MSAPRDGTNRESLDRGNLNTLADAARKIALGSLLAGQLPQVRRNLDMDTLGAGDYTLSTLDCLALPAHAKACSILRATSRAGGVTGEMTVVAFGTTPSSGEIAVAPNGDIVTLASDAITDVDVVYVPERGDVIESVFPVVSNAIAIPTAITARGVVLLAEAEALEGTVTGKATVLVLSGSAATTGTARLDLAKANVKFYSGDAVTRARVKLVVAAAEDLAAVLEAAATLV